MTNIDYNKMPANGYVLAYFRGSILFDRYTQVSQLEEQLNSKGQLLELHVFDDTKEYRLVVKDNGDTIEQLIEDSEDQDTKVELVKVVDTFAKNTAEEYALSQVMPTLKVINYIDYDENGMITINNYRLAPGERGNN